MENKQLKNSSLVAKAKKKNKTPKNNKNKRFKKSAIIEKKNK